MKEESFIKSNYEHIRELRKQVKALQDKLKGLEIIVKNNHVYSITRLNEITEKGRNDER